MFESKLENKTFLCLRNTTVAFLIKQKYILGIAGFAVSIRGRTHVTYRCAYPFIPLANRAISEFSVLDMILCPKSKKIGKKTLHINGKNCIDVATTNK